MEFRMILQGSIERGKPHIFLTAFGLGILTTEPSYHFERGEPHFLSLLKCSTELLVEYLQGWGNRTGASTIKQSIS